MRNLKIKNVTAGVVAATLLGALAAADRPALAQSGEPTGRLVVVSWGGSYTRSQEEALHKPFAAATGLQIVRQDYRGGLQQIRAQVEGGDVYWDVVDVEPADADQGCEEGLFEKLPLILTPAPDGTSAARDFLPSTLHPCAVGSVAWSMLIAVDNAQFPENQPDSIADFFNLEDFPGRRGLRKTPKANLEWALIADGVPADEVYRRLDTEAGVSRAFKKLDSIRDEIMWWEDGDEPARLLARDAVVMTTVYGSRIFRNIAVDQRPYSLIWDHQLWDVNYWAIPKGSRNREQAIEFIRFTTGTEPLAQQTQWIPYGPVRRSSNALVGSYALAPDIDVAPFLPTSPENLTTAIRNSASFWRENGEILVARFNAWLAD